MKRLQKFFYAVLLFSGIAMSCTQGTSSAGGGGPVPQTPATVKFAVTDDAGDDCPIISSGVEHNVTVSTSKALFQVITGGSVDVKIDGTPTKRKSLTFAENGDVQTLSVEIKLRGRTEMHTVKIRYYAGAIKKITVRDNDGKEVSVNRRKDSYKASVPTDKAVVTVETYDTGDTVKIDDMEITGTPKTKSLEFTGSDTEKTLKISVIHGEAEENYTLSVYYSDPTKMPVDPSLKNIKITRTDTAAPVSLSPAFDKENTSYEAAVPADVQEINVEAEADAGIVVEGTGKHSLQEGNNPITVTAKPASDHFGGLSYTINIRRAKSSASANADLQSLDLKAKYLGLAKPWIDPPAAFSSAVTGYELTINTVCDEFYIKAKPAEADAVMTVSENGGAARALRPDTETQFKLRMQPLNVFVVNVTAPDGAAVKTYTVKVKRQEGSFVLKTFRSTGMNDFYAERFDTYKKTGIFGTKTISATALKTLTQTTITAEPEYPLTTKMKIKINDGEEDDFSGTAVVDLTKEKSDMPGYVRVQIILISSVLGEDDKSAYGDTYTLWIEKKDPAGDPNDKLKALNVSYYGGAYKFYQTNLNETFSPDKTDYTLTLPQSVKEIRVEAVPDSNKAYIDGWLGQTVNGFDDPFSEIKIPVVAENGNRKEYKIAVTRLAPPSITIDRPENDEIINVGVLSSGYEVTGSFTDPEGVANEIWVGSSGLPIQERNGGKWVKAKVTGNTFKATLPALSDLPNGDRDVKVGIFGITGQTLAVQRVPIKITGNAVPFASLKVEIKNPAGYTMPANAVMSVFVLDDDLWGKSEDVVYGSKVVESVDSKRFPMTVSLGGIKAQGTNCRVEVQIYNTENGKDILRYYGVVKSPVHTGQNNTCEVDLKTAQ